MTHCKVGYEVCYAHCVHKVFIWFTRPFLHTQPISDDFCLQPGVEIQHVSLHMHASAVFYLLIFVSIALNMVYHTFQFHMRSSSIKM